MDEAPVIYPTAFAAGVAAGRREERAAIVAWLRRWHETQVYFQPNNALRDAAHALEQAQPGEYPS